MFERLPSLEPNPFDNSQKASWRLLRIFRIYAGTFNRKEGRSTLIYLKCTVIDVDDIFGY